jgi:double-stranded uracil-DNA glycosylase
MAACQWQTDWNLREEIVLLFRVSYHRAAVETINPESSVSGPAMLYRAHCFEPVGEASATVLILGSMPGKVSIAAGEYYAHPRNHFWPIMGELVGAHPDLPYEERLRVLNSSGIALWDVLQSCIREGSLDSDIVDLSATPNDFDSLFLAHPKISHVFFNGAKAEECFRRHVQPSLSKYSLQCRRLPSTSPANAGMPYGRKLDAWRAVVARSGD